MSNDEAMAEYLSTWCWSVCELENGDIYKILGRPQKVGNICTPSKVAKVLEVIGPLCTKEKLMKGI